MSRHPHGQLTCDPWITCTIEPHQRPKKKRHHTCKHVLKPDLIMWHAVSCWAPYSLGQSWKKNCCRGWSLPTLEMQTKWWRQVRRQAVSTFTRPTCETLKKKAGNSLYLNELLIQKCKFRHQVVASTLCLDKHSPKGSCHLDESSMNHTLAQNHLCEIWCGLHRTCKTLQ